MLNYKKYHILSYLHYCHKNPTKLECFINAYYFDCSLKNELGKEQLRRQKYKDYV
jgi:hypothetical protein